MQMTIARLLLDQILAWAAADPGREVCGLLFGDGQRIDEAQPTRNVSATPERTFEIDPQSLFAAIRAEREGGPRLIGHYHSHPSGSAIPSACDAEMAEPGRFWLIVSGGGAQLWRAEAGGALHGVFTPIVLKTCDR
jgi:proteasome lid subunit RPN8/RPN11